MEKSNKKLIEVLKSKIANTEDVQLKQNLQNKLDALQGNKTILK